MTEDRRRKSELCKTCSASPQVKMIRVCCVNLHTRSRNSGNLILTKASDRARAAPLLIRGSRHFHFRFCRHQNALSRRRPELRAPLKALLIRRNEPNSCPMSVPVPSVVGVWPVQYPLAKGPPGPLQFEEEAPVV